jgi:hypothetical protein
MGSEEGPFANGLSNSGDRLTKRHGGNGGRERAKGSGGAAQAVVSATWPPLVQVPDFFQNGGKNTSIDADRCTGKAEQLWSLTVDGPLYRRNLEIAQSSDCQDEQPHSTFSQGADQESRPELSRLMKLFDELLLLKQGKFISPFRLGDRFTEADRQERPVGGIVVRIVEPLAFKAEPLKQ